jgi:hypothetical protein
MIMFPGYWPILGALISMICILKGSEITRRRSIEERYSIAAIFCQMPECCLHQANARVIHALLQAENKGEPCPQVWSCFPYQRVHQGAAAAGEIFCPGGGIPPPLQQTRPPQQTQHTSAKQMMQQRAAPGGVYPPGCSSSVAIA